MTTIFEFEQAGTTPYVLNSLLEDYCENNPDYQFLPETETLYATAYNEDGFLPDSITLAGFDTVNATELIGGQIPQRPK